MLISLICSLQEVTSSSSGDEKNPLFQTILESLKSISSLTIEDIIDLLVNFPKNYEVWWANLFREAPQHVLIETTLIVFIVWLLFIRRTVDPKKPTASEKLSEKEIEWLINTWQPEPLVPKLNERERAVVSRERTIDSIHGDMISIRGAKKPAINASSFDFLALSRDESVKAAARDALDRYGCGSCGPRGFYGTLDQHLILESSLAKFMDAQEAINYSDGSSAVSSAIPAFAKKGDLLVIDEACSEPIKSGANLSRSTVRYFRHNDLNHLASILEAIAQEDRRHNRDTSQQRRFIIVEGLYRNIGDVCPLKELLALKEKYYYRMILDETYSFGILGPTGRGLCEACGIPTSAVEIITFTLDTALASVGGICVGTHEVVDHQRLSGAGYCFSASLAPFLCAGATAALRKIESDQQLVAKFQNNSKKLFTALSSIPSLVLVSPEAHGIYHLTLERSRGSDLEDFQCLSQIADVALQNGVAVTVSKFSLLHSKSLKQSLMVCCNAAWTDETIQKIRDGLMKAVKKALI